MIIEKSTSSAHLQLLPTFLSFCANDYRIKIANSANLLESLHVLLIHMKVVSKQVVHTRVHQGMDKALGKA